MSWRSDLYYTDLIIKHRRRYLVYGGWNITEFGSLELKWTVCVSFKLRIKWCSSPLNEGQVDIPSR